MNLVAAKRLLQISIAMVFISLSLIEAFSDETIVEEGGVYLESRNITPAVEGYIQSLVSKVIQEARKGDFTLISGVGQRAEEAIPHLRQYTNDKNDDVRYAVVRIASYSPSEQALILISETIEHPKSYAAAEAIDVLFNSEIDQSKILEWGGQELAENIINYQCCPN